MRENVIEISQELSEESRLLIVLPVWKKIIKENSVVQESVFVHKFIRGFQNRASKRVSNPLATMPDPMIDHIIEARLPGSDLETMRIGHRISMSAENILGSILEEYIHSKIVKFNWSCCWGNAIKAVDACSIEGKLLQIKNRSNSENSSSSAIRDGTNIIKWYRIDARTGKTNWDDLCSIIGKEKIFSEDDFKHFCIKLIKTNPAALSVESTTPP